MPTTVIAQKKRKTYVTALKSAEHSLLYELPTRLSFGLKKARTKTVFQVSARGKAESPCELWETDAQGIRWNSQDIAAATGGAVEKPGIAAGSICTDTRVLQPGQWMLALKGPNFDGHEYLTQAADIGAVGAIGSQPAPPDWALGYVRVPDTLVALQDLARLIRRRYGQSGAVVGITGSAGKTTTRAMTQLVLQGGLLSGAVHATQGNMNNHIGVPVTLLQLPSDSAACVLEMGMNHFGEIALLADIARPNIRLITNVGPVHTEGVGGIDGVARAKGELFDSAREGDICVINGDDQRVRGLQIPEAARVISFGTAVGCHVRMQNVHAAGPAGLYTRFQLSGREDGSGTEKVDVLLRAPGRHLAMNAAAAAAVGLALGIPLSTAGKALEGYSPVSGRMQVMEAGEALVVNDTYNSSPLSLQAALDLLASIPCGPGCSWKRRVVFLGDMLELGAETQSAHLQALERCTAARVHLLGTAGPLFSQAVDSAPGRALLSKPTNEITAMQTVVETDSTRLAMLATELVQDGDVVLVKGSRGLRMEIVVNAILDKGGKVE
ncbi:hypothetical protein CYMTET_40634 [Cymbomonas tetramitiformis]|uniref:UDP-MurNAc-pentapeptide synthetase n=1 Tax=Cymbomonas tetramitiformis TaxID=36881 RepID=A0AAE0F3F7_9CHLO|nr:hypothetical protein CYMTET_40634 [Cymbomonas tetramitiformis]